MMWALLSVISGLFDAIMFASMKKLDKVNNSIIVWVQYAFALPFLIGVLYFNYPQNIAGQVYLIIVANAVLLLISSYLLIKAAKIGDLSTSIPMLSFTPLFLVILSYIMLKELPTFYGLVGIVMVVTGAYIINAKSLGAGILQPLKSILKNEGSFYVLIVAFIWSITANLFKTGILASNPVFFSTSVYLAISLLVLPSILKKYKQSLFEIKSNFGLLLLLGISSAVMIITSSVPMLYAIVPYVISLKRSSVIFSVLIGFYIFKEQNIRNAFIGAAIMLVGGILITLF